MSPEGFELAIPTTERPQADAIDGAATRIGKDENTQDYNSACGFSPV
jgi:hypothetical protein